MVLRPRVIDGIFTAASFAVIAATILMYSFGDRVLQARARERSRREIIANLNQLVATLKDAETGRLGYLLTGDEVYFRLFDDAAKSLTGVLGKVQEAQPLNFTLDSLQTIVTLVREKMTELRATIELRRNGDGAGASAMVKTGRGQKLMENLGRVIGELEREQNEKLKADLRSADEAVEARTLIFLLAACGNILFLGWAYHRISQAIEESEATRNLYGPLK